MAGINTDPVAVRHIELAVVEKGFESGYMNPRPPGERRSRAVAVIGAGPAGLAAADTLNRNGYRVTVFDSAKEPGGILRYGIPDFKLEKWVVDRRIRLMEQEGVAFEQRVTVGEDLSYGYLKSRFDAVCLACGAREPRDLKIPGRDLEGIHFAMDFLTRQNMTVAGEAVDPSEAISATGKSVVVIGGGDTGSDCLGTSLRQGALQVRQFEILPRPPEKRSPATPWPQWPLKLRLSHAHKEGGEQTWSVTTTRFTGDGGRLSGLECCEVEWDTTGEGLPLTPHPKAGTEFRVEADMVLLAMGFVGPTANGVVEELGLARDGRGIVEADAWNMTGERGLFTAGDMALGQSLVVRAIADGRKAALGIMRYLSGMPGA